MGACQELTMTWVKNLDLDDKSINRKSHGLLGSGMLYQSNPCGRKQRIVLNSWTPRGSYNPFYKCLMIKAFCSLEWKVYKEAIGLDLLLCKFCPAEHTKMDLLKNFLSYGTCD